MKILLSASRVILETLAVVIGGCSMSYLNVNLVKLDDFYSVWQSYLFRMKKRKERGHE